MHAYERVKLKTRLLKTLMTWITYHTSTTPLLSYVWLTGFGYGFARALVREGAPYSNPEPS